jgi:hypothetical protein
MEVSPQATEQAFVALNVENGASTPAAAQAAAEHLQSEGSDPAAAEPAPPGEGLGGRVDTTV